MPEFDNPPVSEVALSVEFLAIEKWRTVCAATYWNQSKNDYPHFEAQFPLQSQIERFGDERSVSQPVMQLQVGDPEAMRYWMLAEPPNRLIQLQQNRFIVNWRKVRGDEKYPRYNAEIRPLFLREWTRFRDFVRQQELGALDVQQCEVTYINDIPLGEGWNTFSDLRRIFAPWSGSMTEGFLPAPETLDINGSFELPEQRGRLHFATQHLCRAIDGKEVIQLRLVASSPWF